jgi:sorting nexin-4
MAKRCCDTDALLFADPTCIDIIGTEKTTEHASSFVVYVIVVNQRQDEEVRRRYSEFDSLRKLLKRTYPHVVVPPIPEKHSIGALADCQLTLIRSRLCKTPQQGQRRTRHD